MKPAKRELGRATLAAAAFLAACGAPQVRPETSATSACGSRIAEAAGAPIEDVKVISVRNDGTAVVTLATVAGFGEAWECRSDVAGLTSGVSYLGAEAEN